jgi:hypothetical protein
LVQKRRPDPERGRLQSEALVAAACLDPVLSIIGARHEDDDTCGTSKLFRAFVILGVRREPRTEYPGSEPSRNCRVACRAGEQSIAGAHGLSLTEANPRLEFFDERSIADLGWQRAALREPPGISRTDAQCSPAGETVHDIMGYKRRGNDNADLATDSRSCVRRAGLGVIGAQSSRYQAQTRDRLVRSQT